MILSVSLFFCVFLFCFVFVFCHNKRDLASCDSNSNSNSLSPGGRASPPAQLMSFLMSRLARAGPLWSREGALGEGRGASSCQRRFLRSEQGRWTRPKHNCFQSVSGRRNATPPSLSPASDPAHTNHPMRWHLLWFTVTCLHVQQLKRKQPILTPCLRVLNCQWQPLKRSAKLTKHF